MANVKIQYMKDAHSIIKYVMNKVEKKDQVWSKYTSPETAAEQFIAAKEAAYRNKSKTEAIHVIQSFDHKTSKEISVKELNKVGQELVDRQFPGHAYLVVTHTDTEHYHNHILINPVSNDLSTRINNKKKNLYDLRHKSNEICIEKDLPIIRSNVFQKAKEKRETFKSYRYAHLDDLKEKVLFAMDYSRNRDDFSKIMKSFGVKHEVRNEIDYFKSKGMSRFKSIKNLGGIFKYQDINKKFNANKWQIVFQDHSISSEKTSKYFFNEIYKTNEQDLNTFIKKHKLNISRLRGEVEIRNLGKIKINNNRFYSEKYKIEGTALTLMSYAKSQSYTKSLSQLSIIAKTELTDSLRNDHLSFVAFDDNTINYRKNFLSQLKRSSFNFAKNFNFLIRNGYEFQAPYSTKPRLVSPHSTNSFFYFSYNKKKNSFEKFLSGKSLPLLKHAPGKPNINIYPAEKALLSGDFDKYSLLDANIIISDEPSSRDDYINLRADEFNPSSIKNILDGATREDIEKLKKEFEKGHNITF